MTPQVCQADLAEKLTRPLAVAIRLCRELIPWSDDRPLHPPEGVRTPLWSDDSPRRPPLAFGPWRCLPHRSALSAARPVTEGQDSGSGGVAAPRFGDRARMRAIMAAPALARSQLRSRTHLWAAAAYVAASWPVAFALQSSLAAVLAAVGRRSRSAIYALDLLAWSGPFLVLRSARLGVQVVVLTLAIAIFMKVIAGFGGLWLALGDAPRDRLAGWSIALQAAVFFALSVPFDRVAQPAGHLTGDEPHYLVVTLSLLRDHDLFVEDEYGNRLYSAFYQGIMGGADSADGHTLAAVGGHLASFHDMGLPILDVVPYAIGGWIAVVVGMGALAALALREVYLTSRLAGAAPRAALAAAALVAVCLPLAVYATENYPEVPIGLAVIVAVRQLWMAAQRRGGHAIVFGMAIATLPWLHVRSWPFAVVLAVFGLLVWRRWPARAAAVVPLAVATIAYITLNDLTFGTPFLSPVFGWAATRSQHVVRRPDLAQLVVSPLGSPWLDFRDGLLVLSPFLLVALAATPPLVRRGIAGAATVAAALGYAFTIGVWYTYTSGGGGPPGRYMVAIVPLLGVLLAVGLDRMYSLGRVGLLANFLLLPAAAWSLALSFLLFANRELAQGIDGPAPFLANLFGLPVKRLFPSFYQPGADSFAKVALVGVAAVLLAVGLDRAVRSRPLVGLSPSRPSGSGPSAGGSENGQPQDVASS